MARPQKVVWSEGMALDPHHFQQWDRFSQANVVFRQRMLQRHAWGILTLMIDEEALLNGQFSLSQASGIMPDGLVFDLPETDRAPDARPIQGAFDPTKDRLAVFLAVPAERVEGRNTLLPDVPINRTTRFVTTEILVRDDNTGIEDRPIQVAKANFQLVFEGESVNDLSTIKIAEVLRTRTGTYELNPQFIPPCLSLVSSKALEGIARRTMELLVAKRQALMEKHAAYGRGELMAADVTTMLFLESINGSIPEINHNFSVIQSHPEAFFLTLLRLSGYLTTYSTAFSYNDFPAYDHSDLTTCFHTLFNQFRTLLGDVVFSKEYERIDLIRKGESIYLATFDDRHLPENVELYLVATGQVASDRMRSSFPNDIRIASPAMIEPVLKGFVRALEVHYVMSLPKGLPIRPDAFYFKLTKSGPFWDDIRAKKALVLFVPATLKMLDLELIALNRSS
ncbi:MAG TPA: type VI secretion system baseplate subunit TssK [Rhodothermales bacterium]|nr:type VI secretion system baseplate subunit TssK [Rhodothermales bacterium]HRR07594.1 type VI secretion system baseplate subunit TssK [Rhodothermales bacterium]